VWLIIDVLPLRRYLAFFRALISTSSWKPCIRPKKDRKQRIKCDTVPNRQCEKVEGRIDKLKDWRRIAACQGRSKHTFFLAISINVPVFFQFEKQALRLETKIAYANSSSSKDASSSTSPGQRLYCSTTSNHENTAIK
jgi:hypothetical protein